ncbi:MAG: enoyl-CoA hydratase/isomerase family protein [Pseudorhodoplanes sp.]
MGQIDDVLHGQVLTVRLAGSGANAITRSMAASLEAIADRAGRSRDVRVLLITGAGGENFCAGSNIGELAQLRAEGKGPGPLLEAEARAFQAIADLDIPTVAAVQGVAMGGGLELALCCDFIVAAEDARMSFPEIFLGVFPALGGTVRLQQRIGEGRARELLMLGREIDGRLACEWGLVTRAVARADVDREARALADRLAAAPISAIAEIKKSLRLARDVSEQEAIDAALAAAIRHSDSPDVAGGLRAFGAKQKPDFRSSSPVPQNPAK